MLIKNKCHVFFLHYNSKDYRANMAYINAATSSNKSVNLAEVDGISSDQADGLVVIENHLREVPESSNEREYVLTTVKKKIIGLLVAAVFAGFVITDLAFATTSEWNKANYTSAQVSS